MNSKELYNLIAEAKKGLNQLITDKGDERQIGYQEGRIVELNDELGRVLDAEAKEREAAACKVVDVRHAFAQNLFGDKAGFSGIEPGWKHTAPLRDAIEGLPTPQIYRRDLPAPVAPPTGFLGSILKGTTEGDEHYFMTPVLTNKAAGWVSGRKPESAIKWEEATAHIETIAHWIPIKRQTAKRYNQLESLVTGALMLGLDLKCDEYALRGNNESGIMGICNVKGTLAHTKAEGKNLKDTFMVMRRKCRVATGIAPNYVCMSPYAIEELSEEKDQVGRYLFPDIAPGGTVAGLTVVEDVNMTNVEDEKETALVYYSGGASWDVADPEEVLIGLTNAQLIENEYTILAELTAALRVDNPACFCYCDDLGLDIEAAPVSANVKVDAKKAA